MNKLLPHLKSEALYTAFAFSEICFLIPSSSSFSKEMFSVEWDGKVTVNSSEAALSPYIHFGICLCSWTYCTAKRLHVGLCRALWWVFLVFFYVWVDAKGTPQCEWELVFKQQISPSYNLTFLNAQLGVCVCFSLSGWQINLLDQPVLAPWAGVCALPPQPGCTHVQTSAFWEKKKKQEKQETMGREILACSVGTLPFLFPCLLAAHHAWRLQAI